MGIGERITRIARSYLESAKDKLGDEWDELTDKVRSGDLGPELLEKLKSLRNGSKDENLSKEEVDEILSKAGYDDFYEETYPPPKRKKRIDLREAYAKLGVSENSSMEQVEKAYKKEIRKYHPDRFATEPEKAKTATKVSQMLSEAYDQIEKERSTKK
jgi:DnaJ-domain-containing protein 1